MNAEFNRTALLGKIRKAKKLAEAARWNLLDVVIFLNAVEEELTALPLTGEPHSGILGEEENHEDYQPNDGNDETGGDQ